MVVKGHIRYNDQIEMWQRQTGAYKAGKTVRQR